ncbi:MAG: ABC transporter ATP-binding protein [Gammaproteobacteria bacterium]|jgi:ABC-type multidrug transport system fused ATPase/permease subunit
MHKTYSKIYAMLDQSYRRHAILLLGLILIGTLLEVLGVGLLLPVIALLVEGDLGARYPVVEPALNYLGNPGHIVQVQITMIFLALIYLAKNIFLAYLAWRQAKFGVGLQIEVSHRLFATYLRQPYHFHLQRNSAHLIRNINGEVSQFINNAVNPAISLVAECLVLFSLVVLLMVVEPLGSIIVFATLLSAALIFYRITHHRITRWGENRQFHDGLRFQHLQQGLGGVKDIKVLGRENTFLTLFGEHNIKTGQMSQLLKVAQALPRLWLEVLAVAGFAILVLIMISLGRETASIVPTVGLFAAAAFRLMPAVGRILNALQSLRYGAAAINKLHAEFAELGPEIETDDAGERQFIDPSGEIALNKVTYSYPEASGTALVDVSINIPRGASIGFIGPSGAGKSTLVDIILGLLKPDSGEIIAGDTNIHRDIRSWQDQIGYVPQAIYLTDDTLRRNVAFGLPEDQIDDDAVQNAIKAAQLEQLVNDLPLGMETVIGERGVRLSGGQRQRIGIARALYHDPDLLVLDEATSALDTETEVGVMEAVNALHGKKTVVIVAHRMSTVENCDFLYRLENGHVVEQGSAGQMIDSQKTSSSA